MKNEIGRKLTSLTIMAIMFAGGMAIGVPSFMPEALSQTGQTSGLLTVSSTTIQGAAVLEVVVNDPDISNVDDDVNAPSIAFGSNDYDMTQASNGKWYVYIVDASTSSTMDAVAGGMEFGILCSAGLSVSGSKTSGSADATPFIVSSSTNVWAAATKTGNAVSNNATLEPNISHAGHCNDIDGAEGVTDATAGTTSREDLTAVILANAPSLSDPDNDAANLGQRAHGLNSSGYGSWPYIVSVDFTNDNIVSYGSDSINVVYGNTDAETSISLANQNPAANTEIHLSFTDPALNIDPTTADVWLFDLSDNDGDYTTVELATNGTTNTAFTAANLGTMGFVLNGALYSDGEAILASGNNTATPTNSNSCCTVDTVNMTESGANTGVFESWNANGQSQLLTTRDAAADVNTVFSYGGNSVDMIITYNDADITMDAGGDTWMPANAITISVNDPDANYNPSSAETLKIADETVVIPTIVMGSPKTLATGSNACLAQTYNAHIGTITSGALPACRTIDTSASTGGGDGAASNTVSTTGVNVGSNSGAVIVGVNVDNTTDHSQRLRITHNGTESESTGMANITTTWINVTTGHTKASLVNLAGTVVLSYDVSGPADLLTSTDINVYLWDTGNNDTGNTADATNSLLSVQTVGNVKAGVVDLDDGATFIKDPSMTMGETEGLAKSTWSSGAGTNLVSIGFEFTHAAGNDMAATADYAIAADFCNFDQNNGSLTHNCIYRLEAVETGADTGIFEGTVEYVNLNNSTASDAGGSHSGNANEVEGLLGYVAGDALTVVLMGDTSGSDSVRVVYNDTDAFQVATKIGAQVETVTNTGTVDLDADTYGVSDIGTITIVDADLNQDSALRDTYGNSSTTFDLTITKAGTTVAQYSLANNMTIIETGPSTGVFVGTFLVPDAKGADMELTYFESKDAAGSAVQYFDTATIQSNTGSVSLDRNLYPTPFTSGELNTGAGTASVITEGGAVTAWLTVSDADETNDTLTTGSSKGTINVKIGTPICFTAGGTVAYDANDAADRAKELGPLSEVTIGGQAYEVSMSISKTLTCTASNITVSSGDVLQVEYIDTADSAGSTSTQYDSATFDLRTGSLTTDKDVYVMGSDMVVTITDPDLNLDSSTSESYPMSILEWDSAASSSALLTTSDFTNNPSKIEETGSDTGVFQTVVTLPTSTVGGTVVEYGESVTLTYQDVGLAGENQVADDTLDVESYFSISNFGALVELDKAVYNWTDTVYITITAPDHNNNSAAEETIGTSALPVLATTRAGSMCVNQAAGSKYFVAAETGVDTGVYTAEIGLLGYALSTATNDLNKTTADNVCSTTDSTAGKIVTAGQTDGISVSYEYTNAVVVVASASIMFNIAEAGFDASSASTSGTALFSVTDADINTDSTIINTGSAAVYSDSDSGGFSMTLVETGEDTGVFEGTVNFTADAASSGSNLRVSEGDTVTAEYTDNTLPEPYADSDTLTVASTLTIGTAFPPLERAPAANARVVDAFGSSVAEVTVDQQVQIAADVSNGQSKEQAFAYLVQVQDENGVTVSLAWITGSLTAGQSMSPALSWTPSASGSYTATVFVWESVDNPTALSPTTSVSIDVV